MLIGRIILLCFFSKLSKASDRAFTIVFSIYLVFIELIPCAYVCYSMSMRLKIYQKAKKLLEPTSELGREHLSQSVVSEKLAGQLIDNVDYKEDVEMLMRLNRK